VIDSVHTNCKISQTRSTQSFSFQKNIHVFIPSFSIPITSYRFCLITFNMSNTRSHYKFVFIFLKRNTDDPDSIPPSCRYVHLHLQTPRHSLIAHTTARRLGEKLREVPLQSIVSSGEGSSPLHLEHASTEDRSELPYSPHFNKNDKSP